VNQSPPLKSGLGRNVVRSLVVPVAAILAVVGCSSSGSHSSSPATSGAATTTAAAAGASGTTAAGSGAHCPTGTAAGATSSQITVASTIINISGGSLSNATVGVPSAQVQKADWTLVADSINNSGGAGCRKIVMKFYDVNPIDATAAQQACLNIAADHPYIVADSGALTEVGASNCIPAHQIPLSSASLTQAELTKYAPYYLQIGDVPEDEIHNGVLGLNQLGAFDASKGFKKLGIVHHNCTPSLFTAEEAALKTAGVPDGSIVAYNLGCPAGQNDTPAAMEQAVLAFKNGGVSDVTEVDLTDFPLFTQVASQQNYKPRYVLNDAALADNTGAQTGPGSISAANFDGAVDVVNDGYGEQKTPGYRPSGGTQTCDAIFSAAGQPGVYQQADGYGGVVCDYLVFIQALLDHAATLQASALAAAMHTIGTVNFSFPGAPIDFSAAPTGSAYGVSFWRPVYYHASCTCFQVLDPTFHKPFA
jgi:hypothetical protein